MFNPTLIRRATNVSSKPLRVKQDLLPTIVLYRRLLRVHNKVLPIQMKMMGDDYLKAEFRRTRETTNPLHLVGFLTEWQKYLDFHEAQLILINHQHSIDSLQSVQEHRKEDAVTGGENDGGVKSASEKVVEEAKERVREGQKLSEEMFEKLSADQLGQLYELLQVTKQIYEDPSAPHDSDTPTPEDGTTTTAGEGETNASGIPKGEVLPDLGAADGSGKRN